MSINSRRLGHFGRHLAPSLAWLLCIFLAHQHNFQQVHGEPEANQTKRLDTVVLFDDVVGEIFEKKPEAARSISKLFGNLPKASARFTKDAARLLNQTGATTQVDDDNKPLVKSLLGVVFDEGQKTLADSHGPPTCPACIHRPQTGQEESDTKDSENNNKRDKEPCGGRNNRCRPPRPPQVVVLPCPSCAPGCLVPFSCFDPKHMSCPPAVSCKPCPAAPPPAAPPTAASTPAPAETTEARPRPTPLSPTRPPPASTSTAAPTTTTTSSTTTSSTTTTTTIDPSKPTELPEAGEKKSPTRPSGQAEGDDEHNNHRDRRSPISDSSESTPTTERPAQKHPKYVQIIKSNLRALINDKRLAKKFVKILDTLDLNIKLSPDQKKEATEILESLKQPYSSKKDTHLAQITAHLLTEFIRFRSKCGPCNSPSPTTMAPGQRFIFKPNRPPTYVYPTNCPCCPTCPPMGTDCPFKPPCPSSTCPPCPSDAQPANPNRPTALPGRASRRGQPKRLAGQNAEPMEPGLESRVMTTNTRSLLKGNQLSTSNGTTCGQANLNPLTAKIMQPVPYISNGESQMYGEWPSYVKLTFQVGGRFSSSGTCGGVLVSDRHVLTAAHCVVHESGKLNPVESYKVTLGEHHTMQRDSHEMDYAVENICRSSKYDPADEENTVFDYAILTLKTKVNLSEYVQPACLPQPGATIHQDGPKSSCFVVGVGVTKFESMRIAGMPIGPPSIPMYPNTVQKIRVVSSTCKGWGFNSSNDPSRICYTKFGGQGDSCAGDSGGPALCLDAEKRWTVTGVVSYGTQFCDGDNKNNWNGVYTGIQKVRQYIKSDCGI